MIGRLIVGLASACVLLLIAAAPARALDVGENFLAPLPDGYKSAAVTDRSGIEASSFVPVEESALRWTRMISLGGDKALPNHDPASFAADFGLNWQRACPQGSVHPTASGVENGYDMVIWEYDCPALGDTRQPETVWLKVIGGSDELYTARLTARQDPDDQLAQQATAYLRYITVCDTRGDQHPCPADGEAPTLPPPPSAAAPLDVGPVGAIPAGHPPTSATPVGAAPVPAQVTPSQNGPTVAAPIGSSPTGNAPTPRQVQPSPD